MSGLPSSGQGHKINKIDMDYDVFPWEDDDIFSPSPKQQTAQCVSRNPFELIKCIIESSEREGTVDKALNSTKFFSKQLADKLGIHETAAFLLAFFVNNLSADSQGTPLITISEHIGTSVTDVLLLYEHLKFLQDNGYIVKRGPGIFTIPDELLECLSEDRPFLNMGENGNLFVFTRNEDIRNKFLFFDDIFNSRVEKMERLLQFDNFWKYRDEMHNRNSNGGLCALFHGMSGTGKTELALQLARKSGRDVLTIDCTQVASKYIGESEKNAKEIFKSYRSYLNRSKAEPVLLLNEADSLLSRRLQADSDGGLDNNKIVNAFLEEMERFEGIMIATCNDMSMLDPAFARRFLFKLEFKSPDEKTRRRMLRNMLDIPYDALDSLAQRNLTGAQIENMSKALLIDRILDSDKKVAPIRNTERLLS